MQTQARARATATATRDAQSVPVPRSPELLFDGEFPRHWLGGDAVATHLINAVNLLFPAGERYFVRSVNYFLPRLKDEGLRARVRGFFGQEGRHAQAHERFFATLEAQGYGVNEFVAWYERIFLRLEKLQSAELNLAVTVALEHYTAIMAENALTEDILDAADPTMRRLLLWHACEEIEHRSVAFDVLAEINPSYPLRVGGMIVATLGLVGFWVVAMRRLWARENISPRDARARLGALHRRHPVLRRVFWNGIRTYLRPGFHPAERDTWPLAERWLAAEGLL